MTQLLESLPEAIESELPRLIDDVVTALIERDPACVLKAHYSSVDGTEQPCVWFEFDREAFRIAFEAEFRATLRAKGFELPRQQALVA